ncbi:MAG: hypothetical protein ABI743_01680 [bacterium]
MTPTTLTFDTPVQSEPEPLRPARLAAPMPWPLKVAAVAGLVIGAVFLLPALSAARLELLLGLRYFNWDIAWHGTKNLAPAIILLGGADAIRRHWLIGWHLVLAGVELWAGLLLSMVVVPLISPIYLPEFRDQLARLEWVDLLWVLGGVALLWLPWRWFRGVFELPSLSWCGVDPADAQRRQRWSPLWISLWALAFAAAEILNLRSWTLGY